MEATKYDLITTFDGKLLIENVNAKIVAGWQPVGGVAVSNDGAITQAMVLMEPAVTQPTQQSRPKYPESLCDFCSYDQKLTKTNGITTCELCLQYIQQFNGGEKVLYEYTPPPCEECKAYHRGDHRPFLHR